MKRQLTGLPLVDATAGVRRLMERPGMQQKAESAAKGVSEETTSKAYQARERTPFYRP